MIVMVLTADDIQSILRKSIDTHLLNRSMLKNTYSPLSNFSSAALIMMSLTDSGEAHNTTTVTQNKRKQSYELWQTIIMAVKIG